MGFGFRIFGGDRVLHHHDITGFPVQFYAYAPVFFYRIKIQFGIFGYLPCQIYGRAACINYAGRVFAQFNDPLPGIFTGDQVQVGQFRICVPYLFVDASGYFPALYMHQRTLHGDPGLAFGESCDILLRNNARIANRLFSTPRGAIAAGQAADLVVFDYVPFTPLRPDTFFGHLLFGVGFTRAHTTIARGKVVVENGELLEFDSSGVRAHCVERASAIWSRIR